MERSESFCEYVVGDRVWVNGTKPGYVQYVGETQFAPGVWAGVKLDDTSGKNDGHVNGVKYFDCEPKRGIFIRPHRLTREAGTPPNLADGDSPRTPSNSVCSTNQTSSPTSPTRGVCSKLKIGEKVFVNASSGVKSGTLRYIGPTDFAAGDWAGVELDHPTGKNDGSVGGKRYFDCKQNHGLFTPMHKISRAGGTNLSLPKPGALQRRSYSRESLSSTTSSVASSKGVRAKHTFTQRAPSSPAVIALQEALKEKVEHIEQLLRERELERHEYAMASTKSDKFEQQMMQLKQKHESYKQEKEAELTFLQKQCQKAEMEAKNIFSVLDDEKRKMEDLQFRLEEETILKTDLEAQAERDRQRIEQLDSLLKSDELSEVPDRQNNLEHSCDAKLELEKRKLELQNLSKDRENLANEAKKFEMLAKENEKHLAAEKVQVESLKKSLEEKSNELFKISADLSQKMSLISSKENVEKELMELKSYQDKARTDSENKICQLVMKVDDLSAQLNGTEGLRLELQNELEHVQKCLEKKDKELESMKLHAQDSENRHNSLVAENNHQLKELENKVIVLQGDREVSANEIDKKLSKLFKENENLSDQLKQKDQTQRKLESEVESLSAALEQKKTSVDDLQSQLKLANAKLEEALKSTALVVELQKQLAQLKDRHSKGNDLSAMNQMAFESEKANLTSLLEESKQVISIREEQIALLEQAVSDNARQLSEVQTKLNGLENEKAQLSTVLRDSKQHILLREEKISSLEKAIYDSSRQLEETQAQLSDAKSEITVLSSNSTSELNALRQQLSCLESEAQSLHKDKEALQRKTQDKEGLVTLLQDKDAKLSQLDSYVKSLQESISQKDSTVSSLQNRLCESEAKVSNLVDGIAKQQAIMQEKLAQVSSDKELAIKAKFEELESMKIEILQHKKMAEEMSVIAEGNKRQLRELQESVSQKDQRISELDNLVDSSHKENEQLKLQITAVENQQKSEFTELKNQQQKVFIEKEKALREKLQKWKTDIEERETSLASVKGEVTKLESDVAKAQEETSKVKTSLENDNQKLALSLENEVAAHSETQAQNRQLEGQCKTLTKEKEELIEQLRSTEKTCEELQKTKDLLLRDKEAIQVLVRDKEDKLSALQLEVDKMHLEFAQHKEELQQKIDVSQLELDAMKELKKQMDMQQSVIEELQQQLHDSEKHRNGLVLELSKTKESASEKLQLELKQKDGLMLELSKAKETANEKQQLELHVVELSEKLQANENIIEKEVKKTKEMEKKLVENMNLLKQKDLEAAELLQQLASLQAYAMEVSTLKAQVKKMEEENTVLSNAIVKYKANQELEKNFDTGTERESLLSQVEFLNAIIADQHKTIDELKKPKEEPADKDLNFNGVKKPAPRLFCDICDMFDLHDTEDCPKQSNQEEDEDNPTPRVKNNAERYKERPYCNNCEMFGHWTLDCDQETF